MISRQGILKGEVSLYCWSPVWQFGISCMKTDKFCFNLQTSQTGGQRYSDNSPFSIPWSRVWIQLAVIRHQGPMLYIFTAVMHCNVMVILPLCAIRQCYCGNYCGVVINYHKICITNVIKRNLYSYITKLLSYDDKLPWYFHPRKSGVKITAVHYPGIFIALAKE